MHALVEDGYRRSERILTEHMDQLHGLAKLLIDREKLDFEQFDRFMKDGVLPEDAPEAPAQEPVADSELPADAQPAESPREEPEI